VLCLAPSSVLLRPEALLSLGVAQLVVCGGAPPERAAALARYATLHLELPLPDDAAATVNHFAARGVARGGVTVIVGRDNYANSCTLGAAALIASEGLSAFDAALRVRDACPAGPVDILELGRFEALSAHKVISRRASWLLNL